MSKSTNYKELITLSGNEPVFRHPTEIIFSELSEKRIKRNYQNMNAANNFTGLLKKENSAELLETVYSKRNFKSVLKKTLDFAKKELKFGENGQTFANPSLKEKLKSSLKGPKPPRPN